MSHHGRNGRGGRLALTAARAAAWTLVLTLGVAPAAVEAQETPGGVAPVSAPSGAPVPVPGPGVAVTGPTAGAVGTAVVAPAVDVPAGAAAVSLLPPSVQVVRFQGPE